MGLWTDADGMRTAADILVASRSRKVVDVTYYLFGHGIEVALKSFLLASGTTLDALKKEVGHDLVTVAHRSIQVGNADISKTIATYQTDLETLNTYYKAKEFEYRVTGFKSYPHPDRLTAFLTSLLRLIKPIALAAS